MRKLTCQQVTGWPCDFEAEGDLNTQVMNKLLAHITGVHAGDLGEDEAAKKAKLDELKKKASRMLPMI